MDLSPRVIIIFPYFFENKMRVTTQKLLCVFVLFVVVLVLGIIVYWNLSSPDESCVRQTSNGPVEGIVQTSALGQKYYAFRGIPFAEPPITGTNPYTGELVDRRFKVLSSLYFNALIYSMFNFLVLPH